MSKDKLAKGEQINYLDYVIKNCTNNDGVVLLKPGAHNYESHLGNYGNGENLDNVKISAIVFYMIARPEIFATTIMQKILSGNDNGTYHEYFKLKNSLKNDGIKMPEEITEGDSFNFMIYYKGKPLKWILK
jgi:hypothetical protein